MVALPKFHPVKLIGLNDRAKKLIKFYNNEFSIQEYDELGKPLNIYEGKNAIFCVSPDGFINTWFVLDEDVRFEGEYKNLIQIFKDNGLL